MGQTALWCVARLGQKNDVVTLIEAGADVAISNQMATVTDDNTHNAGVMPVFVACRYGYSETVALLLTAGCDVNKTNDDGATPLSC